MRQMISLFVATLALVWLSHPAEILASQSETLSVVVDLEVKITQKVKTIISPVDPDAIVLSNVEIKKVDTELIGTQMTAVGIMSTSDVNKVDEADIESISVTVLSSIDDFPKEVAKMVESTVVGISKKGKVTIGKMDESTREAIQKTKEYRRLQAEGFQKIGQYAGQLYEILGWLVGALLAGFAVVQFLLSWAQRRSQAAAVQNLAEKIASIRPAESEGGSARATALPAEASLPSNNRSSSSGGGGGGGGAYDENVIEMMPVPSLRALLSDAYWCEKDGYAAWVWARLSPSKRKELLTSWPVLGDYALHLNQIEKIEDQYHFDPHYLSPSECHHLSNVDLQAALKKDSAVWGALSLMRRQHFDLGLRERLELSSQENAKAEIRWPTAASNPRSLPPRLEISSLSLEDETLLLANPDLLPLSLKSRLPSLVWLAHCSAEDRSKILQKIPAQGLAEAWVAPPEVLEMIQAALPDKKRDLLLEYIKKTPGRRSSPWLSMISEAALEVLRQQPVSAIEDQGHKRNAA